MKILIVSYENCYNGLSLSGHTVDYYSGSIFSHSDRLADVATDYDLVINNSPWLTTPSNGIGNTAASARLETHKWETRAKAKELGFLLPEVLEECNMNAVSTSYTETVFLKPKENEMACIYKIDPSRDDIAWHNTQLRAVPGYVEKDIEHDIEGNCFFTMRNGEYKIQKVLGYTGTGEDKRLQKPFMTTGFEFTTLTSAQETAFLSLCTTWLDYAKTLGGTYQGEICAGIKGADVYWFEQNSRRGMHIPFTGNSNNWLESLRSDLSKAGTDEWNYG